MKITPTAGRVIIKRDDADTVTRGGIVLPDQATEKPKRGKIVALGKGRLLDNGTYAPVELTEGLTAVFYNYSGHEVEIEGDKFLVMEQTDVVAVIS